MKVFDTLFPRRSPHDTFNILTGDFDSFDYSNPKICHGGGKGGGGGGDSTVTQTSTTTPPPEIMAAYQKALGLADTASSAPLQQYSGNTVAGFTPDQTQAFGTINNAQGAAQPYINQAAGLIQQGTQPLWNGVQQFSPNAVQQYMNPYTQQVLDAATAGQQNTDAMQQQALKGNAISSGAWGGDRAGVASAVLSGQQDLANNQTNAGILNQAYTQGLGEFNTQQQAQLGANEANAYLNQQGAFGLANLGSEALGTQLQGASSQLQSGALQQQLNQENLNVPYQNFLQQQAYPFQTAQYYSNIAEGLGSNSGGTSTGTTTSPSPSSASSIAGLGLGGLGIIGGTGGFGEDGWLSSLFAKRGGRIQSRRHGGGCFDTGGIADDIATGVPDLSLSFIPQTTAGHGSGPPKTEAPASGKLPQSGTDQLTNPTNLGNIVKALNSMKGSSGSGMGAFGGSNALDPSSSNALDTGGETNPLDFASLADDAPWKRGGRIQKRAIGGEVLPDILSGVGDIVGAFFGMPMAGDMGVSALSSLDGGRTGGNGVGHQAMGSIFGARGGRMGYDDGGMVGGALPSAGSDGQNPIQQIRGTQDYQNMTVDQLQRAAQMIPPGSPHAQEVNTLLQQKRIMPNVGVPAQGGFGTQATRAKGGRLGYDDGGSLPMPIAHDDPAFDVQNDVNADSDVPTVNASDLQPPGAMGSAPSSQMVASSIPPPGAMGSSQPVATAKPPSDYSREEPPNTRAPAKANPWLALAAAGFNMAAGRSPYALENIGQGAAAGLKDYSEQQKQADTVNEAADKLMAEAKQHKDALAIEQQNADANAQARKDTAEYQRGELGLRGKQISNEAANALAERQKPIPDGMGGFLIPNPQDPTHPQRIDGPLGSLSGTPNSDGSPGVSLANAYNPPKGADGKPLSGEPYLATLPPAVANLAKQFGDNTMQVTPYMMTRGDPAMKAAVAAAKIYNPGWNEATYPNYNRWAFDPNGGVKAKSLDTVVPHLQMLRDLTTAMDTGDVRSINAAQNKIETEFGLSPGAGNLQAASQLVGNEIVNSTIAQGKGAGALGDREEVASNFNNATSPKLLLDKLDNVYMPALRAQANASEQYYTTATHLTDFKDKLLPATRNALWPSQRGGSQAGNTSPMISSPDDPAFKALPSGATFTTPDGRTLVKH